MSNDKINNNLIKENLMKFNRKELLKSAKEKFDVAVDRKEFELIFWSECPASRSILDDSVFTDITPQNIGGLITRSLPVILCDDDIINLTIGKESTMIPGYILKELKYKDFLPEYEEFEKSGYNEKLGIIKISLIEESEDQRKALYKKLKNSVEKACDQAELRVIQLLKSKVKENIIYFVECTQNESSAVFDGSILVASGNDWDFHQGYSGTKYRSINLGDYNGPINLAEILAHKLKKKIVNIEVNREDFSVLCGDLIGTHSSDYRHFGNKKTTMRELALLHQGFLVKALNSHLGINKRKVS